MARRLVRYGVCGVLLSGMALVLGLAVSTSAYAAVGDGGSGVGSDGLYTGPGAYLGPWAENGFGWYMYDINGPGPQDFKHGKYTWAKVREVCSEDNAKSIVAYILLRADKDVYSAEVRDDTTLLEGGRPDAWNSESHPKFRGNDGPPWYNRAQVRQMYERIVPANQRIGFNVGYNVGWFCYDYSVTPPAEERYDLTPKIVVNDTVVELGVTVPVERTVENTTPTGSKSRETEWRMTEIIVRAGTPTPAASGGDDGRDPCIYRVASSCDDTVRGGGEVFGPGSNSLGPVGRTIDNLDVGDKMCWGLSVRPFSHDSPATLWRHSALFCLTVSKTPKVQLWGADVRSAKNVSTRSSTIAGVMYGSWAEYAIMSSSGMVSSASGASMSSGPEGRLPVSVPNRNRLTFANVGGYGGFGTLPSSSVPQKFTDTTGGSTVGSAVDLSGMESGEYRSSNSIQLSGNVRAGRDIIVKTTGIVKIDGNITYDDGPYTNRADIPQLVISANAIIIEAGVTEVNAWLIATGTPESYVSTCGAVNSSHDWLSGVTAVTCSAPLRINGPTIANHLYLRRTGGSDTVHRGSPAEVLNLRPDAYLWANARAHDSGAISTMRVRELPPRF